MQELNVYLLEQVKMAIADEPKQFVMDSVFVGKPGDYEDIEWGYRFHSDVPRRIPNCGTAACIAGWACAIAVGANPARARTIVAVDLDRSSLALGEEVLGLDHWQAEALFHVREWPEEYKDAWRTTEDLDERAQIAIDRIDWFIATGGTDSGLEVDGLYGPLLGDKGRLSLEKVE